MSRKGMCITYVSTRVLLSRKKISFVNRTWFPENFVSKTYAPNLFVSFCSKDLVAGKKLWKPYYVSHAYFVDIEGVCALFCSINKGCTTPPPFCKKNLVARPFSKQNLVARPLCKQNLDITIVNCSPLTTK